MDYAAEVQHCYFVAWNIPCALSTCLKIDDRCSFYDFVGVSYSYTLLDVWAFALNVVFRTDLNCDCWSGTPLLVDCWYTDVCYDA